jgi:heat shock protein HslJ
MKKLFIFSITITFFACCCSQKNAKQNFNLYDKTLTLTELNGEDITAKTEKPATVLFNKTESKVSGSLGCNRFSGTFEINGKSLKISQLIATKMMCFNAMEIEDEFGKALNSADNFEIKDNSLLLKSGDKVLAVLK